jgi:hypothetical protein
MLSRRDFLKLGGLSTVGWLAGSLPFQQSYPPTRSYDPFPAPQDGASYLSRRIGRVAHDNISVYKEPTDQSFIMFQRFRDEVVNIYFSVEPETGQAWNPVWYRVWGGYLHRVYVQLVDIRLNPPMQAIPRGHQLCEVTVPYSDTYIFNKNDGWVKKLRIYYTTTHWIMDIVEGPNKAPWYRIYDELEYEYFAPASHFRPIPDEELTPISPDVPDHEKRIEVSRARQTLIAYEGDTEVLNVKISSGIPTKDNAPEGTNTPPGTWNIYSKMPSKHMGDGNLTSDLKAYELTGVPWTSFFHEAGVAFHGAYWHDNFGLAMSHGCVNMRPEEAKWLFRWTTPVWSPDDEMFWERRGFGTTVIVK